MCELSANGERLLYVGETTGDFKTRINHHRYTIRKKRQDLPVVKHFDELGHIERQLRSMLLDHIPPLKKGGDPTRDSGEQRTWITPDTEDNSTIFYFNLYFFYLIYIFEANLLLRQWVPEHPSTMKNNVHGWMQRWKLRQTPENRNRKSESEKPQRSLLLHQDTSSVPAASDLKMFLLTGALIWLVTTAQCIQVHGETYKMTYNPNVFDDQYIGCSDTMEKDIMPKVLQQEMANKQFRDAWINATERWEDIRDDLELPEGFEDEYGIALLTFTNHYPKENPIYRQLNGNLTIAGASRRDYMEKFHFKALHFYLTRALQILKPNCHQNYTTYRGSPHSFLVRPVFKFGRFTSSSLKSEEAQVFGTQSFFRITTCFGARLGNLSFFPDEEEVLIPPTEKFLYVTRENLVYYLRSTGETCSYFNCAYLQAEKRKDAVCGSDAALSMEEGRDADMMSARELEERMSVLEDHISQNHLNWDQYRNEMGIYLEKVSEIRNITTLSMEQVTTTMKDFTDSTLSKMKDLHSQVNNEGKIMKVLTIYRMEFDKIKEKLKEQEDTIHGLILSLLTFIVTGASILIYKYWMRNPSTP
ncbi:uncharacterized protein LOC130355400 [Hyla sarda]|uniref:uncharacterized protein LOC130355400 n=1 Tax=Hyla sarda TaxID=327740 RepID=UPI0024C3F0E6|nr:uncharacterized protein LOC130355400 [Hyla sarda]